jgi:hypothetical protein
VTPDPHSTSGAYLAAPHAPYAARRRRRSFWHPRWPLLAAILLTPTTLIGYGVKIYYLPNICTLGRVCQLDTLPGLAQVALIWLAYLALWALAFALGGALDGPVPPRPYTLAGRLTSMSRYQPVRGLLGAFGLAALAGIALTTAERRIDPAGFAMAAIVVFVAARVYFYTPPEPKRLQTMQAAPAVSQPPTVGQLGPGSYDGYGQPPTS